MNQELNIVTTKNQRLLICSDLHGNLRDFEAVCQKYFYLKQQNKCDLLVLAGDLIHGYPGYQDQSLELLSRARSLKDANEAILLMGNHELSHLMHWDLKKGSNCFTSRLEMEMEPKTRVLWMREFLTWPLAIQTSGGVLINHSGASQSLAGMGDAQTSLVAKLSGYRNFYLDAEFKQWAKQKDMSRFDTALGESYLKTPEGALLWEVFFNKNEHTWGSLYPEILNRYLAKVAPGCNVLVSMHIEEPNGYRVVDSKQLRICSSYGVPKDSDKRLLLLESDKSYQDAPSLTNCLIPLY